MQLASRPQAILKSQPPICMDYRPTQQGPAHPKIYLCINHATKNIFFLTFRCPLWRCVVVDLPNCDLLCNIELDEVGGLYECQQIRSYRSTSIILFAHKSQESSNTIVTVDVLPDEIKMRSVFPCKDVVDVALFTGEF